MDFQDKCLCQWSALMYVLQSDFCHCNVAHTLISGSASSYAVNCH